MTELLVNEKSLDEVEREMLHMPQIEFEVEHKFVEGFYLRVFKAKAGSLIISKRHKTFHTYCISEGKVSVFVPDKGWETIQAPYNGVTLPNTRRALVVHEDMTWTTAHPLIERDLDVIEDILIDNSENPLLSDEEKTIFAEIKQFHSQNPDKKELENAV